MPSVVALIPARAGSQRVKDKNIRPLAGHPTIAYTIAAARESGVFDAVVVSTDSKRYADIARHYGARRSRRSARPRWRVRRRSTSNGSVTCSAISKAWAGPSTASRSSVPRRPSGCRRQSAGHGANFKRRRGSTACARWRRSASIPARCGWCGGERMMPLLPLTPEGQPWHSTQMAALPEVHVQNASLEIAWTRVALVGNTIAGDVRDAVPHHRGGRASTSTPSVTSGTANGSSSAGEARPAA